MEKYNFNQKQPYEPLPEEGAVEKQKERTVWRLQVCWQNGVTDECVQCGPRVAASRLTAGSTRLTSTVQGITGSVPRRPAPCSVQPRPPPAQSASPGPGPPVRRTMDQHARHRHVLRIASSLCHTCRRCRCDDVEIAACVTSLKLYTCNIAYFKWEGQQLENVSEFARLVGFSRLDSWQRQCPKIFVLFENQRLLSFYSEVAGFRNSIRFQVVSLLIWSRLYCIFTQLYKYCYIILCWFIVCHFMIHMTFVLSC